MSDPDPGMAPTALTDPVAMRALAHPLRLTMLRLLSEQGPATATQLAGRAGVSVPSAGYHLKQLAKYGFVEDAAPRGKGRERPWRARARGVRWAAGARGPAEFTEASRLLRAEFIAHALGSMSEFHRMEDEYPAEWQEAAFVLADMAYLTPGELRELNAAVREVFVRYRDRPADQRPVDAAPVRLFGFGVPEGVPHAGDDTGQP